MAAVERLAYGVTQAARASWFIGQYVLAMRASREPSRTPRRRRGRNTPSPLVLRELCALFIRDLENIEAGYYRMPHDMLVNPAEVLRKARLYFDDLKAVNERRARRGDSDVLRNRPPGDFPRYYLQNFHYQTDGWLSRRSAELYDYQVEVLFSGGADAMRRQALVPLYRFFLGGHRIADSRLLDVACGTGRFLTFVKQNYPRLPVTALDLSPHYLEEARVNLAPWSWTDFVQAPAEAMPLPDASYDVVTSIYLFHELPREVQAQVAREIARVLKPGGVFILADSIQHGDRPEPEFARMLDAFPKAFHEPYYADYTRQDLTALFGEAGLVHEDTDLVFATKVITFRKPD